MPCILSRQVFSKGRASHRRPNESPNYEKQLIHDSLSDSLQTVTVRLVNTQSLSL